MKYRGFFVKITSDKNLLRKNKNGEKVTCEGFKIEIFSDESERLEIDVFSAAVDFEQFAKDYIDCEEKEYQRMLDEFNSK